MKNVKSKLSFVFTLRKSFSFSSHQRFAISYWTNATWSTSAKRASASSAVWPISWRTNEPSAETKSETESTFRGSTESFHRIILHPSKRWSSLPKNLWTRSSTKISIWWTIALRSSWWKTWASFRKLRSGLSPQLWSRKKVSIRLFRILRRKSTPVLMQSITKQKRFAWSRCDTRREESFR